jgi:hypothetical protein
MVKVYHHLSKDDWEKIKKLKDDEFFVNEKRKNRSNELDKDAYVKPDNALFAFPSIAFSYFGRPERIIEIDVEDDRKIAIADMDLYVLRPEKKPDKYKKYIESIQEFTEDWREKIKYNQPEVLIDWTTGIPKNRINKIKYRPYKKDENYKIRINTSEQYLFNIIEKQRKDKIIIKLIDLKENDKFLEKTLEGKKQWIVKTKEDLYPPYMKLKEDEQQSLQSSIDTYIQTKGAVNISDEDIYFGIRFEYKHLIGSKYGVYLKLKNFRGYGIAKPV